MNSKLTFIILNYNTYEDTVLCIESIYRFSGISVDEIKIVIVDNASTDDSVKKLKSNYAENDGIVVLKNNENLGFARGNNVGISYALKEYSPEFIVVLNSDTELIQEDFYQKVLEEYCKSKFALLGPLVINGKGRCDNSPYLEETLEQAYATKKILLRTRRRIITNTTNIHYIIRYFYFSIIKKKEVMNIHGDYYKRLINVVPCGCFLVFSRDAFNYISGFDERTFLYYEEQILFQHLKKHGLTTVYTPNICIYHKEGSSSSRTNRSSKERKLFENKCSMESLEILIGILESNTSSET